MWYLALIALLAIMILLIVNYDIMFNSSKGYNIPARKIYKQFLYAVMAYYISDLLWGVLYELHLTTLLIANVVLYYIVMASGILNWTRYVVAYLADDNIYSRLLTWSGRIFFVGIAVASIASIFTPVLFWFDEAGEYHACPARYGQLIFQIVMVKLQVLIQNFKLE